LNSETSFCLTGAGHQAFFHPGGRRGACCTLLKRWQAWVKMRGGFGDHFPWQAQYFVDLCQKVPEAQVKHFSLHF